MAFWNRKEKIEKAPAIPAGATVTQFTQEELAGLANQAYAVGTLTPLQRQAILASIPFGPSSPLTPSAINPVRDDGRPNPRRYEYPVAWNIFVTEQRLVPWKVLRGAADQIDLIRRCIEVRKNKIAGMNWDITFSDSASEQIAAESGGDHIRAMAKAREKFTEDIAKAREFWQTPDRINGLSFKDWLNMMLEEIDVLDALAIYPHPDMKGELHSLEIIDGSTIKPLLDDRGMRPRPPFPAYQQILYGFPRGEFVATSDDPSADGTFSADELIYLRRTHRTWTPYGFSPVERCLPLADIYLRRQQWLRSEFTDGVMPDLMFESDPEFGGSPELLKAWETILNDDLSGQTEQRRRARIIPAGLKAILNAGHSEKFNDTLDEYIIKGISGHFGVLPTEIGYADGGALGGAGQQEGETDSASTIGIEPLVQWLEQQLSDISYKFLGMPRELEFRFEGGRKLDSLQDAQRRQIELQSGQRTLNEARSEMGLPLLDVPQADTPMLFSTTITFVGDEETEVTTAQQEANQAPQEDTPAPEKETPDESDSDEDTEAEQKQEIKAFIKWAKKGNIDREFEFKTLDLITANAFNYAAKTNDIDTVKSLADMVLGKELGTQVPQPKND